LSDPQIETNLAWHAGGTLLRRKLGFLNFSAAAGMDPTELLRTYLAAACDPNEEVVPLHRVLWALSVIPHPNVARPSFPCITASPAGPVLPS
jgi:hypothetical protein